MSRLSSELPEIQTFINGNGDIANMLIYVFIKNFLPSTIGIRVVIYIVGICILSLLLIQISCGFNKMILTKNSRLK